MIQAAKRCDKGEGIIVPVTLRDCFATGTTVAVPRLRAPAERYARDDKGLSGRTYANITGRTYANITGRTYANITGRTYDYYRARSVRITGRTYDDRRRSITRKGPPQNGSLRA